MHSTGDTYRHDGQDMAGRRRVRGQRDRSRTAQAKAEARRRRAQRMAKRQAQDPDTWRSAAALAHRLAG